MNTMPHRQNPDLFLFGSIWAISSFAGLAAMLRSGKEITFRLFLMSLMNSGFFGCGVALLLYEKNPFYEVVAISIFAGLGGMSIIEFFYQGVRKWWPHLFYNLFKTLAHKSEDLDDNQPK